MTQRHQVLELHTPTLELNRAYFDAQDVILEPWKVKNADQKDSEQN